MPKVSVYMDNDLYEKLKVKAKEKEYSLSELIRIRMSEYVGGWPQDFFDLLGSWEGESIDLPEDLPWSPDENGLFD